MAKKLQNIEQPFDKKFVSTDSQNRSKDISLSDTNFDKFSLTLETIDELIVYYIKNSIKPTVRQNNQNIEVDVIFGNEELFNTVQAEGYYRDKNEKLLYPLIILNRTSVEKNNDFFTKIDANYPEDFYFYENFLVSEVKAGVAFTLENAKEMLELAKMHFGKKIPFVYIANRINSYSFNPTAHFKTAAMFPNLKGYGVVIYDSMNLEIAQMEQSFFNKPVNIFSSLEDAINWVDELIMMD